MTTDDDLRRLFADVDHEIDVVTPDPSRPRARARQRRQRRTAGGVVAAAAIAVGGFALIPGGSEPIVTADGTTTTSAPSAEAAGSDGASEGESTPSPTTAPALEWERIDTPLTLHDVVWTGERFVGVGTDDDADTAVYASDDGRSWTPLDPPDLPIGWWIDSDGNGRVLLLSAGEAAAVDRNGNDLGRVDGGLYVSDDSGDTWEAIPVDLAVVDPADDDVSHIVQAAVTDDRVVLAVLREPGVEIAALLADAEIDADPNEYGFGYTADGVEVCVDEFCESNVLVDWDQLDVDEATIERLTSGPTAEVWERLADGTFVRVETLGETSWVADIAVVGDTIMVSAPGGPVGMVRSSAPGEWTEVDAPEGLGWLQAAEGRLYGIDWSSGGIQVSDDLGDTWERFDVDAEGISEIAVGPGGVLALSDPMFAAGSDTDFGFTATKDGFDLEFDGLTGVTLTESATGEIVIAWPPEILDQDEPPEGIVVDDDTGDLTFLDPATGEPLVVFTQDDLDGAAQAADPETGEVSASQFDPIVTWSPDGERWSSTPSSEAFGAPGSPVIAVGRSTAVAIHFPSGDDVGEPGIPPSTVFVADLG